jgi:hypothetical protein
MTMFASMTLARIALAVGLADVGTPRAVETVPVPLVATDIERCAAVATLAKADWADPDGVVRNWIVDFADTRLARCDWQAFKVSFPRGHDRDKPMACGPSDLVCADPNAFPRLTIEWPDLDNAPTWRRCDGPVGWCRDDHYTMSVRFMWVRASLLGGGRTCDLAKTDGSWALLSCRDTGPAI